MATGHYRGLHAGKFALTRSKPRVPQKGNMSKTIIKVCVDPARKAELKRLAASANTSMSKMLLTCFNREKILTKADHADIKEIARCAGIVGKYTGMLKLHLDRHEFRDYTSAQLNEEFKKARAARAALQELCDRMLGK